jgi:hypothetical protein
VSKCILVKDPQDNVEGIEVFRGVMWCSVVDNHLCFLCRIV